MTQHIIDADELEKKNRVQISHKELTDVLDYNPDTGLFSWKVNRGTTKKGEIAGRLHPEGYMQIGIFRKLYQSHRLAWLYMTGEMPKCQIDHIDRNRANNNFSNLRLATNSENLSNRKSAKNSTSKYLGVCLDKQSGKWRSSIKKCGKITHLGLFCDEIEAAKAYDKAAKELHKCFANPNFPEIGHS